MSIKSDLYFFPSDIYSAQLSNINGIKFTPREIDVIACVLHGKNDKAIAQLLTIPGKAQLSFRTVRAHLDNITRKIESGMRQNLIKFIEESGKFQIIHEYYTSLLVWVEFRKILHNISNKILKKEITILIVKCGIGKEQDRLVQAFLIHLNIIGIKVKLETHEDYVNDIRILQRTSNIDHTIYILPFDEKEEASYLAHIKEFASLHKDIMFLGSTQKDHSISSARQNLRYINIENESNYYILFLNILQYLFPQDTLLPDVITKFSNKLSNIEQIDNNQLSDIILENSVNNSFFKQEKSSFLAAFILVVISVVIFCIFESKFIHVPSANIRSDFILPVESVLLDRSSLIDEIKEKIEYKNGIQTIALVGVGGAGKTTLARLYAYKIKADIVWEINAETTETLKCSFENLANALATGTEDKEILQGIKNIEESNDKENQLISFVKERLKLSHSWFLIYDNVESFASIHKYFPQDSKTWGNGNVIITTRNSNIQSNALYVNELNTKEKYELFTKILSVNKDNCLNGKSQQDIQDFLGSIPPFPLDISIAAHYLKTTKIPFDQYLEHLNQESKDFELMQHYLLGEGGSYLKTRYNIIILSLQNIIKVHPDFESLLVFISMLDSQDIPRNLLEQFKGDVVVDNFIYHLRKYSLITSDSTSVLGSGISIHRSTQNIMLSYLIKSSNTPINKIIQSVAYSLDSYIDKVIEEDLPKIMLLLNHCTAFYNHTNLLNNATKALLHGTLGRIYFSLGDVNSSEVQKYLSQSIEGLRKYDSTNYYKIAQFLIYLGITYRDTGQYSEAVAYISEGLALYNKHFPKAYSQIALASVFLGMSYFELGDYKKSQDLLERSSNIYYERLPNDFAAIARAETYLGWLNIKFGNYKKAEELFKKSIKIYKEFYPKNYLGIQRALLGKEVICTAIGNCDKIQTELEEVINFMNEPNIERSITQRFYATVLEYTGLVYISLGNYTLAKDLIERSIAIYRTSYSKNSPRIGHPIRSLGKVYLYGKNFEEASSLFNQSFQIFNEHKHPDVFFVLEDLAILAITRSHLEKEMGRHDEAKKYQIEAENYLNHALKVLYIYFPERAFHEARIKKLQSERF